MSGTMPDLTLGRVSVARRIKNQLVWVLVAAAFLLALVPLVSVLYLVVKNGLARFDGVFFTHSMRNIGPTDAGGGAYHAILGTVEQVALASLIAIPLGLLTAVYLVEFGGQGRPARTISFFVDVMTGVPSIVAGLFVLAFWVLALGMGFSGFAGALALTVLMLPVIVRSSEEMLRLVPNELREASAALGVPNWRTTCLVVLPTALPGVVTGIMLAIARVMGETAPLLLTVFFTDSINPNPFNGPQVGLPQFVFDQATKPDNTAIARAWSGALTLIVIIMLLNLVARLIAWLRRPARH